MGHSCEKTKISNSLSRIYKKEIIRSGGLIKGLNRIAMKVTIAS